MPRTGRGRRTALALVVISGLLCGVADAHAGDRGLPVVAAHRSTLPAPGGTPFLGVVTQQARTGLVVARVVPGSPADAAGLRAGDVIRSMDGRTIRASADFDRALARQSSGATVSIVAERGGRRLSRHVRLSSRGRADALFRGALFRLALVPLRFDGEPAGPSRRESLERMFFSYTGRTGAGASLVDYFDDQSHGRLRVDGRAMRPILLPGTRRQYSNSAMGAPPGSMFAAAASALLLREGASAMDGFDGIAFLYEGPQETRPGRALWPHRALVRVGSRRLPYYVHAVGEPGGDTIGEHCHEFAHLLGLPDAYGTGHRTGSGDFCLMAIGHRGGPRTGSRSPFSLCAHCRTRLDWLEPVSLDPRRAQRVRLEPAASGRSQAVVVPLTPRTDEYLLLEVRARRGFDTELPSEGLLVWHVGGAPTRGQGRYGMPVDLVEAHGVDTFDASLLRTGEIAFPTVRARDLTPETRPAIWSHRPGAFAVHLTDIRRERGGAVSFTIGVEKRVDQRPPAHYDGDRPGPDGTVTRIDPITGETVRYRVGAPAGTSASGPTSESGR